MRGWMVSLRDGVTMELAEDSLLRTVELVGVVFGSM
jgi:hypothetical protein